MRTLCSNTEGEWRTVTRHTRVACTGGRVYVVPIASPALSCSLGLLLQITSNLKSVAHWSSFSTTGWFVDCWLFLLFTYSASQLYSCVLSHFCVWNLASWIPPRIRRGVIFASTESGFHYSNCLITCTSSGGVFRSHFSHFYWVWYLMYRAPSSAFVFNTAMIFPPLPPHRNPVQQKCLQCIIEEAHFVGLEVQNFERIFWSRTLTLLFQFDRRADDWWDLVSRTGGCTNILVSKIELSALLNSCVFFAIISRDFFRRFRVLLEILSFYSSDMLGVGIPTSYPPW